MVAEVTTPSLGVGFEIARAENMGKKILCLYRPGPDRSLSPMIAGNKFLTVIEYKNVDELDKVFLNFIK